MQIPLQITFRGMSPSPVIDALVRERSQRIERFYERIIRCHVVVGVPHRHHRKGRQYAVHLDIRTAEKEIVVARNANLGESDLELQAAVRDAFDAATRQLDDGGGRRRRFAHGARARASAGAT